jgi:hypothetical protein
VGRDRIGSLARSGEGWLQIDSKCTCARDFSHHWRLDFVRNADVQIALTAVFGRRVILPHRDGYELEDCKIHQRVYAVEVADVS